MPIYEYECKKCSAHLEVIQKITDKPRTRCGKCGGRLEKQWSSTSFQFKGSGWYVTDYAAKKSDAKDEKGSASTDSSSASDSSESGASKTAKGSDTGKSADTTKSSEASSEKPATSSSKKESSKPTSTK